MKKFLVLLVIAAALDWAVTAFTKVSLLGTITFFGTFAAYHMYKKKQ
jgi:uncharacterized membrane protein YuzA (DUF378 family)